MGTMHIAFGEAFRGSQITPEDGGNVWYLENKRYLFKLEDKNIFVTRMYSTRVNQVTGAIKEDRNSYYIKSDGFASPSRCLYLGTSDAKLDGTPAEDAWILTRFILDEDYTY